MSESVNEVGSRLTPINPGYNRPDNRIRDFGILAAISAGTRQIHYLGVGDIGLSISIKDFGLVRLALHPRRGVLLNLIKQDVKRLLQARRVVNRVPIQQGCRVVPLKPGSPYSGANNAPAFSSHHNSLIRPRTAAAFSR